MNTHCLRLVLEIKSFYTFSPLDNLKASFHCSHLSKKFQIFTAEHKSNVLNSTAKIHLSNLSPNLSAYLQSEPKHLKKRFKIGTQNWTPYLLIAITRTLLTFLFWNQYWNHAPKKPLIMAVKIVIDMFEKIESIILPPLIYIPK